MVGNYPVTGLIPDQALYVSAGGYAVVGNPNALKISGQITLVVWVKPQTMTIADNVTWTFIDKGYDGATEGYYLRIRGSGGANLEAGCWDGSANQFVTLPVTSADIPVDTGGGQLGTMLAGRYDGAKWSVFINGVKKKETAATGAVLTTANVCLGAAAYSGSVTTGYVGDLGRVSVFSTGLSDAQLLSLYQAGTANAFSGPSVSLTSNPTQGNAGTVFTVSGTASGMTGSGTLTVSDTYGTLSAASIVITNNGTVSFTDTRTTANLTAATTVLLTDSTNATGSGTINLTTNLMAIPTNLSVTTNGTTSVSLIADETTGTATQILVQTAPASGFPTWTRRGTLTLAAGVAFGTIGGLAPATSYKVRVAGLDAYGNNSLTTDSITPPTFTTWVTMTVTLANSGADLTGTMSSVATATDYQYAVGAGTFTDNGTNLSFTITNGATIHGTINVKAINAGSVQVGSGSQAWQVTVSVGRFPWLRFQPVLGRIG